VNAGQRKPAHAKIADVNANVAKEKNAHAKENANAAAIVINHHKQKKLITNNLSITNH
jgi:hypothetical protein